MGLRAFKGSFRIHRINFLCFVCLEVKVSRKSSISIILLIWWLRLSKLFICFCGFFDILSFLVERRTILFVNFSSVVFSFLSQKCIQKKCSSIKPKSHSSGNLPVRSKICFLAFSAYDFSFIFFSMMKIKIAWVCF